MIYMMIADKLAGINAFVPAYLHTISGSSQIVRIFGRRSVDMGKQVFNGSLEPTITGQDLVENAAECGDILIVHPSVIIEPDQLYIMHKWTDTAWAVETTQHEIVALVIGEE